MQKFRDDVEALNSKAITLELAIRGALASDVIDGGDFGQALSDAATELAELSTKLVKQIDHP